LHNVTRKESIVEGFGLSISIAPKYVELETGAACNVYFHRVIRDVAMPGGTKVGSTAPGVK